MKPRYGIPAYLWLAAIILIALLAYFLGKKNAIKTVDNIAVNNTFITEIAEMASLEAHGVASIQSSNITNDGSFTDAFRKMFAENTLKITIPYVAKYGVDLSKQAVHLQQDRKKVTITMPPPQLLSYELRMDRTDAYTRKGILAQLNEEQFAAVEKKLYNQSRTEMAGNEMYLQQSKQKIAGIMHNYYAPLNIKDTVVFQDDTELR